MSKYGINEEFEIVDLETGEKFDWFKVIVDSEEIPKYSKILNTYEFMKKWSTMLVK